MVISNRIALRWSIKHLLNSNVASNHKKNMKYQLHAPYYFSSIISFHPTKSIPKLSEIQNFFNLNIKLNFINRLFIFLTWKIYTSCIKALFDFFLDGDIWCSSITKSLVYSVQVRQRSGEIEIKNKIFFIIFYNFMFQKLSN